MKQIPFINGGWGQEGGRPGEKRRQWEKRGREVVVQRWWELGKIEKIFATCCNRNGTKKRQPLRRGTGSRSKRYGKRE